MAEARMRERSLLTKALSPSGVCATPFELSSLADGSLAEPAAVRLREHLSDCPRCQTELTLLNYFENAAPTPDEERAVRWISARLEEETIGGPAPLQAHGAVLPRRSASRAMNLAGFALATVALGAAITIGLREHRVPELTQPSLVAPIVLRSAAIRTLSPAGVVDAAPEALRWEPQTGAASYSVQLMEVDRAGMWSAETRDATISLPEALRAQIVPGKPLLWEVVAKDAAGRAVAWSGEQPFKVSK
jgi:anti-sigma factor RsiW